LSDENTTKGPAMDRRPMPRNDRATRSLLACGLVAPPAAIVLFILATLGRQDYSHVRDTISKLSAQGVADRWEWTGALLLYAALMACFAAGLRRRFGGLGKYRWLWGSVAVHAALMTGVAFFRDDLRRGGFFTLEGALHDILSGMAFSALVVLMLATSLVEDGSLRRMRRVTRLAAVAFTVVGVVFVFTPPEVQGVPQRLFVGVAALWIVALAGAGLIASEGQR